MTDPVKDFAKEIIQCMIDDCVTDGFDVQELAMRHGLIVDVPYDPIVHGESDCCEPGDSWFVFSELLK